MKYWRRLKTRLVEPEASRRDEDVRSRLSGFSAGGGPDIASLWEEQTLADRDKKQRNRTKNARKNVSGQKVAKTRSLGSIKKKVNRITVKTPSKKKLISKALRARNVLVASKHKKIYFIAAPVLLLIASLLLSRVFINNSVQQTLGQSNTNVYTSDDLPRERAAFQLLYPGDKSEKDFEIVRVSPSSSAPVYTYLDKIGETNINVSQQELPERFKDNRDAELEKIAKDFQASSIIKVDQNTVYHGFNEKANIQSIIFIKNEILFLVRAQNSVSDDQIVGYVLSLK